MKTPIILFDGPCVLCNAWVNRLCRWDRKDQLRFASLDSKTGQQFFKERNLDPNEFESVVFWIPNVTYALEAQATFDPRSLSFNCKEQISMVWQIGCLSPTQPQVCAQVFKVKPRLFVVLFCIFRL